MDSRKPTDTGLARYLGYSIRSPFGWGTRWFRQVRQHDQRAVLTQIEAIVRTNAPLPEGLLKCSMDAPNARDIYVLRTLSERTDSGMGLADAMQSLGSRFPTHFIAQVRAGEQTGQLAKALQSIITNINAELEHGRLLRNHTVYFIASLAVQVQILLFLTVKVFPVFMEVLGEFGSSHVPRSARAMAVVSRFVDDHWIGILAGAGLAVVLILALRLLYRASGLVQSVFVAVVLWQRSAGGIFRRTQVQRLSRALELRLTGGVPLAQALNDTAAEGLPRPYRRMLEHCAREVENGAPLSSALAPERKLVGRELPELVRLGETREDLVWAFHEAVQHCTRSNRRAKHVWAEALVPIGVAFCAIGVITATTAAFGMFAAMSDALIADL